MIATFLRAEWLPLLAELAAKATLILVLAGLANVLLWRASAALRHMVWCVAVVGVLALPVFSVVLPAWEVPVLPVEEAVVSAPPAVTTPIETASAAEAAAPSATGPHVETAAPALTRGEWLTRAAAGLAATGVLAGLLWLALGFWGVARLGRRAQVVRDPEWLHTANEAAEQLGLRRPVLLLRDRRSVMPATGGLLWPSVVLPVNADEWSGERRHAVLAHELAHVKRFDTLTQALAQVACALFWWHPAVWYAAKRLRVERERACDDLVLRTGTRPSAYAAHLLEIARAHKSLRMASPALVSMARPSHLESRLLWVLDAARARSVPSVRATLLTALAGLLVVAPLAAMRPTAAASLARADARSATGAGERDAAVPADEGVRSPAALTAADDEKKDGREKVSPGKLTPQTAVAQVDTPPGNRNVNDLIAMRAVGVDAAYIAEMRAAGYTELSSQELISLRANGVSGRYAEQMNAAGWGRVSANNLVGLKANGITAAWLEDMRRQGVVPRTANEAMGLKAVGVDAAFVEGLRSAGYETASARDLTGMRAVGVTPAYIRELADQGLTDVAPGLLQGMAAVGVDGEYVADLRAAGVNDFDAGLLTGLRALGVTGAYVRELRDAGLTGVDAEDLAALRANHVTGAYIRELREAGFDDLSADEVVRLRASGTDRELIDARRRKRP